MIYDASGVQLYEAYDSQGNSLTYAYDAEGSIIFSRGSTPWYDEITIEKLYNASADTFYYVVTIPQTRTDGSKQYPFVFVPNGSNGGTMSTLTMMQTYAFYAGMNGGYFDYAETGSYKPYGINIQNSVVAFDNTDTPAWQRSALYTLTIDEHGSLGYADTLDSGITAQGLLNAGAVSALLGFVPLVVNGMASEVESAAWASTDRAQRQIIGQKNNGDYVIVTCEGRNFDNSIGFTVTEAQQLCLSMGLKFAMCLDGGGSTETVIGNEQLNTIYEGSTGRIVPTYIVFNGTDTFNVPNPQ